jgi:hypothetical protein
VAFPRTLRFDGRKYHMDVRTIPRRWSVTSPYGCIVAVREVAPDRWQAIDGNGKHLLDLPDTGAKRVPLLGEARDWEFGQATFAILRRAIGPVTDLCILDVRLDLARPQVVVQVVA